MTKCVASVLIHILPPYIRSTLTLTESKRRCNLACVNGNLAHLGAEHKALYADKVAYVKKFLEHYIVQVLVLSRAKVIAAYINLNTAFGVLKLDKTYRCIFVLPTNFI